MGEANPLASLSPLQIKQLQRVFYALDKDLDGRVSEANVADVLGHLGSTDAEAEAHACFADAPATLEMMSFLTHMARILARVGDAHSLAEAFASFDEKDEGMIDRRDLHEILGHDPALIAAWEVPAFMDRAQKRFDYRKLVTTLGMCAWSDVSA
ncbi:Similar to S.cerevisiae protein CMD1 (Calmodulin) [Malassezia sympodialis ATCC 42132]|uniref:Similar to S.cerevisiae protein CMD1 (Calmodulin) n=1 Tax=Malassezia sympodialis (strain ATCC 42132) TaxID=1230383 RepID=A0A1M8ABH5_MALS4|nr:Similar to S.cerevisiae protein CMD1 (Calmodulin) [Malassezia sympodialis ATCC 42132]